MSDTKTINAFAAMETGGVLERFSYEVGELSPDEVEVDVHYCGICHSDLSMIDDDWGMSQFPLVAGHEVIGTIAATGTNVRGLEKGMTVGLGWHSGYCGQCASCKGGDQDKVAVIGIGGLGHIALKFLNAWGCEVTAFTSSESKRQEALELGAHKTLNSRDPQEIEAAAGSFDFVISTVNVKLDWDLYLNTLKPRGRLHFVGATLEPLDIGVFSLLRGQRSVSGSPVGSPATIAQMLEFANLHDIRPQGEGFPMDEINAAIDHLRSGKARYRVVLSNR